MKIAASNVDGDAPKALAIGKQLFNAIIGDGKLERAVQWVNGGDIYYICALKMGSIQRLQVINVNPFKITSAVNHLENGREYPEIQWQGGTPPFQVQVVYKDADGIYQTAMADKLVNLGPNLIDGTGDSTTNRNYYLYRVTDIEGWWADDGTGAKQDAIGFLITDSVNRKLFAPFTPAVKDPLAQLYSHYGPPEWCEPPIDWPMPATMVYSDVFDEVYLNAVSKIPGTAATEIPGHYAYISNAIGYLASRDTGGPLVQEYMFPYMPSATDANGVSPNAFSVTLVFTATDSVHYPVRNVVKTVMVSKAGQTAPLDIAGISPNGRRLQPGDSIWVAVLVGDPLVLATSSPSGLPWHMVSNNTNICTVANGGILALQTQTSNYDFGATYNPPGSNIPPGFYIAPGTYTAYMVQITAVAAGNFVLNTHAEGNENYTPSTDLSRALSVSLPMNGAGGIYFDINDSPITYGEGLDFTLTNNSGIAPNAINYPAKSDPANPANTYQDAGFSVDPITDTEGAEHPTAWGSFLTPNLDGTDHAYSITATFHPNDLATYPEMGYEQWLTVTKDTPVILYSPPAMTYGDTWNKIKTAKAYNSHHINLVNGILEGEEGWEIPGTFTYTIQNKNYNNGVISDFSVIPTAGFNTDTSVKDYFDIQVSGFIPSGPKAYCYDNNATAVVATNQHIERFVTSITATPGNTNINQGGTFSWSNVVSVVPPGRPSYYSDASPDNGVTAIGNSYRFDQAGTFTVRLDTAISPNGDADITNDFISWTINVGAGMYIVSFANDLSRKITFGGGTGPYSATVYNVTNVCLVSQIGPDYVQITPCNPQNSWCHNNGYVRISDSAGHYVDAYLANFQSGAQPPPVCDPQTCAWRWIAHCPTDFFYTGGYQVVISDDGLYKVAVSYIPEGTDPGLYCTISSLSGGTLSVSRFQNTLNQYYQWACYDIYDWYCS